MLQETGFHGNGSLLIFEGKVTSGKVNSVVKHSSAYKPNEKIHHVKKEKVWSKRQSIAKKPVIRLSQRAEPGEKRFSKRRIGQRLKRLPCQQIKFNE